MIPKIIHLCWFGKGEYNDLIKMCLYSWEQNMPDYKIMIWNEYNFDVNSNEFTKIAYKNKKWAFVSDYVRLNAVYNYGGIYMDCDIEVIKNYSSLLEDDKYISCYQEGGFLSSGFFAAPPKNKYIKDILNHYNSKEWDDNNFMIMNPIIFTKILIEKYNIPFGKKEIFNDDFSIYSMEYFMPYKNNIFGKNMKRFNKKKYNITKKTYCIHHELGSWNKSIFLVKIFKGILRLLIPFGVYNYIKTIRAKNILDNYRV